MADDADWNAAAWHLREDVAPTVLAVLEDMLLHGPTVLRISALWLEEKPDRIEHLDRRAFLSHVGSDGLGTKTAYVVASNT
ncbi:MAG TPA: hypothetical protein VMT18_15225 [Planctomycetota bacterium]|nr:hypothetical protein [Planctomycetota bacterium]